MSFETEIIKPRAHPIVIQEIDIARNQEFWTNYLAPVWYFNIDALYAHIPSTWLNGISALTINSIGSVIAGSERLNAVTSIADCISTESSFYFDQLFNNCYVHCPDGNRPQLYSMKVGDTTGFVDKGSPGFYLNNIYYEPRIESIPSISRKKSKEYFGIIRYGGGASKLTNSDGYFDTYTTDNKITGQESRIKLGFSGDDNYELQHIGHISTGTGLTVSDFTIDVRDNTKAWTKKLPDNFYSQTTYSNLKDNNIGKGIPIIYGQCLNVECICENEEEVAPASYTFKICDVSNHSGINSIDAVYVDGTEVTPDSTDTTNAEFVITVASGDYTPGQKVTADVKGVKDTNGTYIEEALEVIKDLLNVHYSIPYTSTFYDFANWSTGDDLAIGYWIGEGKQLNDIINEITKSSFIDLIIQNDGKIAGKIFNKYSATVATYTKEDVLSYIPLSDEADELYSAIEVKYCKDWANNEYRSLHDNTYEDDVLDEHNIKRTKTYNTLLTSVADAQTFATYVYDFLKVVKKVFKIEINYQAITRKIGDIIQVELDRPTAPAIGTVKAEIIGMTVNYSSGKIMLDCRVIEVIGDLIYMQGYLYRSNLFRSKLYGRTKEVSV